MSRAKVRDGVVELDCKIKKELDKAICISTYDPSEDKDSKVLADFWFPLSTVSVIDRNAGTDLGDMIVVEKWITDQKGLT